jgi:signal peptidase II
VTSSVVPVPVAVGRRVVWIAATVVAVDQLTKTVAGFIAARSANGPLVPVRNPEFSLGLARASLLAMLVAAIVGIAAAGVWTIRRARDGRLAAWVPGLLLGGAVSNLADRIMFGSVRDFLATPWVVFNLADVAVLAAIGGLIAARRPEPFNAHRG